MDKHWQDDKYMQTKSKQLNLMVHSTDIYIYWCALRRKIIYIYWTANFIQREKKKKKKGPRTRNKRSQKGTNQRQYINPPLTQPNKPQAGQAAPHKAAIKTKKPQDSKKHYQSPNPKTKKQRINEVGLIENLSYLHNKGVGSSPPH